MRWGVRTSKQGDNAQCTEDIDVVWIPGIVAVLLVFGTLDAVVSGGWSVVELRKG
jgi:hypothetical protein